HPAVCLRFRQWDERGGVGAPFRTLLHHEGAGRRQRPGAFHGIRNCGPERRGHPREQRSGARVQLRCLPASRRGGAGGNDGGRRAGCEAAAGRRSKPAHRRGSRGGARVRLGPDASALAVHRAGLPAHLLRVHDLRLHHGHRGAPAGRVLRHLHDDSGHVGPVRAGEHSVQQQHRAREPPRAADQHRRAAGQPDGAGEQQRLPPAGRSTVPAG
ncbi:hypothetical protein OY671_009388, partial [Metschnikowia pulcherrima]